MKSLVLAAVIASLPAIALADSFEFTLKNTANEALTNVSVSGGKVEGFKKIPSNGKRTFNVILPDGECIATLTATFDDGESVSSDGFDFCQYNEFEITFG